MKYMGPNKPRPREDSTPDPLVVDNHCAGECGELEADCTCEGMPVETTRQPLRSAGRSSQGLCTPRETGDFPPDALCTCGDRRDEHAEFLPAPCWKGVPDEIRYPKTPEGLARSIAFLESRPGCKCLGFCPAKPVEVFR